MSRAVQALRGLFLLTPLCACRSEIDAPAEPQVFVAGEASARVSACLGYSVGAAINFFGHPLLGAPDHEVGACVHSASDCDGVLACLGYSVGECEEGCEASVARHCRTLPNGIRVSWREDCSRDPANNHECKLIVDAGKGDFSGCFEGTTCEAHGCTEEASVYCEHGYSQRVACAAPQTCTVLGEASLCADGGSCQGDRCEGEQTLVLCNGGAVAFRVQCEDVLPGTVCDTFAAGEATCVAKVPHPSCPIEQPFTNHCEGDLAIACMVGIRYEVDCGLVGAHCDPADSSARCVAAEAMHTDE